MIKFTVSVYALMLFNFFVLAADDYVIPQDLLEVTPESKKLMSLANYIIDSEIKRYNCILSDKEVKDALLVELKNSGSFNFEELQKVLSMQIAALRDVVVDKKAADQVYSERKLAEAHISSEAWGALVRGHKTVESINALEKKIPSSLDAVSDSGINSFRPIIQRWLLIQHIIGELDIEGPQVLGQPPTHSKQMKNWWKTTVSKYISATGNSNVSLDAILPLFPVVAYFSPKEDVLYREMFSSRLKLEKPDAKTK